MVIATSDQLLRLRDAALSINASLSLPETLQHVVAAAAQVANARYAALGVPDESGELLAEFVTHGLTREAEARIAYRPKGHGLLGLVLRDGQTLRLRNLSAHASSSGFPPGHPPMTSFLGVPVIHQGRLLGDLYLTDKQDADEFSEADQTLIELLAANAAQAIANAHAHANLQARHRELAALNAVITATSRALELDTVLDVALHQAMAIYQVESLDLYLVARMSGQFVLAQHHGPTPEPFLTEERSVAGHGVMGQVAACRRPRIIRSLADEPGAMRPEALAAGFVSLACLPLLARSGVIGILNLFGTRASQFDTFNISLLESLCGQIGVAIENAQLHEQVGNLAVTQDRRRIGMDLHDGVIQTIYAAGLGLELALADMERGETPNAQAGIRRSIGQLRTAVYDIRAYLLALRPKRFEGENLVAALQRLLREYQANTQIASALDVDAAAELMLSDDARGALFHMAQEALSNSARHGHATQVRVALTAEGEGLLFSIHDNGSGLPSNAEPSSSGYGLRNMHERARALGGNVRVRSAASGGTDVSVHLPATAQV